jgi:phosphoribosyl 1,2-cyclic phosphate phosphodiesterase
VKITFLGTGTSIGIPVPLCGCAVCRSEDVRDRRLRPSIAIAWDGGSVLVDTSPDLRQQVLAHGITRVDAVLYTHAHADHLMGLDDLRPFNWKQGGPVPMFGSPATLDAVRRTFWYAFDTESHGHTRPSIDLHPVEAPFDLCGRRVVPVPLMHGRLAITGWRVGPFAYLTDVGSIPERSYALLAGLDTLVLSALRPRPHPTHLTIDQAVSEARRIGARRTLFTHMSHDVSHAAVSERLPAGIELAADGLIIAVDEA